MTKPAKQWEQDLPPWVRQETEAKRKQQPTPKNMPARKPSALAPKPAVKPKEPEIPQLHIRVTFQGSITFRLEGEQAKGLRELLAWRGASADEIVEALDPWASGASVRQTIDIIEDPVPPGGSYYSWSVDEERGTVKAKMNRDPWGPFKYTLEGGGQPDAVEWKLIPLGGGEFPSWQVTHG